MVLMCCKTVKYMCEMHFKGVLLVIETKPTYAIIYNQNSKKIK